MVTSIADRKQNVTNDSELDTSKWLPKQEQ